MHNTRTWLLALVGLSLPAGAQISIPTVLVGNPGNPHDQPDFGLTVGSVSYSYHIGKYEVTNAEYAAFLNHKAASDPTGLYHSVMQITQSGSDGNFTYAAAAGAEDKPVFLVGFWDACRFCNWLSNGQGDGDTETGVYDLSDPAAITGNTVSRDADAWAAGAVALPLRDEWYKAAYHQPASEGGDADDYWSYATRTNAIDTSQANYAGSVGSTQPVGSYPDHPGPYGTFDMNGNVEEWIDGRIAFSRREARGGSYGTRLTGRLTGRYYADYDPNSDFGEFESLGFRVVSLNEIGGGGGGPDPGPVALRVRRAEPGSVVVRIEGKEGDEWELRFSPALPAASWELRTTATLGAEPFEFTDAIVEGGQGFYILTPVAP